MIITLLSLIALAISYSVIKRYRLKAIKRQAFNSAVDKCYMDYATKLSAKEISFSQWESIKSYLANCEVADYPLYIKEGRLNSFLAMPLSAITNGEDTVKSQYLNKGMYKVYNTVKDTYLSRDYLELINNRVESIIRNNL